MKKAIVILILALITVAGSAQFFKPVPNNLLSVSPASMRAGVEAPTSKWIIRPAVQVNATQVFKNKESDKWESAEFKAAGFGISYQHFIQSNGSPVTNYGVTLLGLLDGTTDKLTISPAVGFNFMQFVSVGVGYNVPGKHVFGLLGIQYNFN